MHEAGVGSFEQARERALDMLLDFVAYYNVHFFFGSHAAWRGDKDMSRLLKCADTCVCNVPIVVSHTMFFFGTETAIDQSLQRMRPLRRYRPCEIWV